jgi:hypothetical protein
METRAKVGDNAPPAADPAESAREAKLNDLHARTCKIEEHLGIKRNAEPPKPRKRH